MSVETAAGFDPYRAWLGINEVHRPLNAYELLCLAPLEEDEETIRSAAHSKRVALESHRGEASPAIWQQLYGELEEAIQILLDPDRKTAYDLTLNLRNSSASPTHFDLGGITDKAGHGTTLQCGHCGTPSPATRKFCAQCGTALWEPCFNCGTLSSTGERFCGACGTNLGTVVQQKRREYESSFADVAQLQESSRFDDAIAVLSPISRLEHPRLKDLAQRANQAIKQLIAQRDRRLVTAETALAEAREHFDAFDYDKAQRALTRIPTPLQNEEMQELLADIQARRDEIRTLNAELEEAVRTKRTGNLWPKLERLLALKPDHTQAEKLANALQQRVGLVAKEKLLAYRYEEALHLLEDVPETVRINGVQKLYEHAAELSWLSSDLRNAPVVDKTLLAIGDRLRKLAPKDPRTAKFCDEVKRRAPLLAKIPTRQAIPWASAPKTTPLGLPVEWAPGFERLPLKEEGDHALLAEYPGSFFVAAGLALQGVGKATVTTNLMPKDMGGVLGKMSRMIRKRPAHSAWGVDIGTNGIKAVRISLQGEEQKPLLEESEYIEHRKPLSQAVGESEEHSLLQESLEELRSRKKLEADRICLGLPSRLILSRHLQFPAVDVAKIPNLVQFEARHQIPFELDEIVWDFQRLNPHEVRRDHEVLLLAVKRAQIDARLELCHQLGITPHLLQGDCLAMHNLFAYELFGEDGVQQGNSAKKKKDKKDDEPETPAAPETPTPKDHPAVALLDIGVDGSSIVVSAPNCVWFRALGIGGQAFTRALVQEFNLTFVKAEQLKHKPQAARRISQVYEALEPLMDDFVREVQRSFTLFEKQHPNIPIQRLYTSGGGLRLHGLLRYLRLGK